MPSNPQNLIRSWNTQANFANGRVVMDRLTPPAFTRIRTPFVMTWREDNAVVNNLDWDAKNFSVYLPESLRVIQGIYLKIECPQIDGGTDFKAYPGLQVIKQLRVLSGGSEAYKADCEKFLVDYCQSLTEEQLKEFSRIHLGGGASPGAGARTFILPIMLPNSPYMLRNGHDTRGFGVFPCFLGTNRLELQITLNPAVYVAADSSNAPASIAAKCSLLYHQVEMTPSNTLKYSDLRGNYSIINRRFTELTNDYQHYTASQASNKEIVRWTTSQPQGVVAEIQVLAVATGATRDRYSAHNYVKPTVMRVLADTVIQKELDEPHKVDLESWCNGFTTPADFPAPGRICFACHCGDSVHTYTGGYSMTLASNIVIELAFPSEVRWKIVAVQYQRVSISSLGNLSTSLE